MIHTWIPALLRHESQCPPTHRTISTHHDLPIFHQRTKYWQLGHRTSRLAGWSSSRRSSPHWRKSMASYYHSIQKCVHRHCHQIPIPETTKGAPDEARESRQLHCQVPKPHKQSWVTLDEEATLNIFQNGLPDPLMVNIIKFHHPVTWDKWTAAAHLQHQEYIFLKDRTSKREKHFGGTKGQWQKVFSYPKDPNAMDIGRTRARETLTKEDKQRLQAEGQCFHCQKQGHISCNCPQKTPACAAEASTCTIASASTPLTTPPTPALTDEQKANTIIARLGTQLQGVRNIMADKMFREEEDFSEAWTWCPGLEL